MSLNMLQFSRVYGAAKVAEEALESSNRLKLMWLSDHWFLEEKDDKDQNKRLLLGADLELKQIWNHASLER